MPTFKLKRREFLMAAAGAGALTAGGLLWQFPHLFYGHEDHEFYSSYGAWTKNELDKIDPPTPSYVVFFKPRRLQLSHYPVPLRLHSGVQDPLNKNFFVFISKWGQTICSFDRTSGAVLKIAQAAPGRRFFGHAVWDEASGGFWVGENDDAQAKGFLVLRNRELELVREIPSHGVYPHEVKLAENGVLQVCNTGDFKSQHGLMAWVNTQDGRLLKSLPFSETKGTAGPSHFLNSSRGGMFIGSITKSDDTPSTVWRVRGAGAPETVPVRLIDQSRFMGEVVSWAESPAQGLVMWTQSKTKAVFSLAVEGNEPARVAMPIYPHGMISDGDDIFVTKNSALVKWSKGQFKSVARGPALGEARWGSHIMRAEI